MTESKVIVAMSGGVDSAVAAALLKDAGYDVMGVTMRLWVDREEEECRTPSRNIRDAYRVARLLKIPFRILNAEDRFYEGVVVPFINAYASGRTPNPCLACNRRLKFGFLYERAREMGAEFFATGHYVRVRRDEITGKWQLLRGVNAVKDQSYMLYALTQEILPRLRFPLGDKTKAQVRSLAVDFGLPVADKEESQDICFTEDYRDFLSRQNPTFNTPGPILNAEGDQVGEHDGLVNYTIGQRRGLGIGGPEALYVTRLVVAQNAVIVGGRAALGRECLTGHDVNWIAGAPPPEGARVLAAIRYHAAPQPAAVHPLPGGRVEVRFDEAQRRVAPGQGVVFYDEADEVCLGGAIIE